MQPPEKNSKIESVGNIRSPQQVPAFYGSAAPIKGLKTYVHKHVQTQGKMAMLTITFLMKKQQGREK